MSAGPGRDRPLSSPLLPAPPPRKPLRNTSKGLVPSPTTFRPTQFSSSFCLWEVGWLALSTKHQRYGNIRRKWSVYSTMTAPKHETKKEEMKRSNKFISWMENASGRTKNTLHRATHCPPFSSTRRPSCPQHRLLLHIRLPAPNVTPPFDEPPDPSLLSWNSSDSQSSLPSETPSEMSSSDSWWFECWFTSVLAIPKPPSALSARSRTTIEDFDLETTVVHATAEQRGGPGGASAKEAREKLFPWPGTCAPDRNNTSR